EHAARVRADAGHRRSVADRVLGGGLAGLAGGADAAVVAVRRGVVEPDHGADGPGTESDAGEHRAGAAGVQRGGVDGAGAERVTRMPGADGLASLTTGFGACIVWV